MTIYHGRYWHGGLDRRRIPGYRSWILNDYEPPNGNPLNRFPSLYSGPTGYALRPYCIPSAPFSTDSLGQSFPAGTVWVIVNSLGAGITTRANMRTPGTTTNPLTITPTTNPGCTLDYVYNATGVPSGATGVITVKGTTTNTTYATINVDGSSGPTVQYDVPSFAVGSTDNTLTVKSTWTGGTPLSEGFVLHPLCNAALNAVAVPSTLPAGYTLRLNSDNNRGGNYANRNGGDPRRLKSGPYTTYETMGFGTSGAQFGVPCWSNSPFAWINGVLYGQNGWAPIAVGQATFSAQASYISGETGTTSSFTCAGLRYLQVSFAYQKFVSDPAGGDTFTWTVTQDGTTIGSGTVTGSAIKSIPTQSIAFTPTAIGGSSTFQITCSGSGGTTSGQPDWECSATIGGSPRCDIPLMFTCVGPGNIAAPGGYVPSLLSTPVNSQPLTRVASGVTSIAFGASAGNGAFLPTSDGWWKVTKSGTPQQFISEDERDWQDKRTAARGRTGRPFYCRADTGGTLVLAPFSPPSPTAISGGGTACTQGSDSWSAWCSVTFPTTALYRVTFTLSTANISSGLIVDQSSTDPAVVNPTASTTWEPYTEIANSTFQNAVLSTPPSNPGSYFSWIVGANPTGAWAGQANSIAVWDNYNGAWVFRMPTAGSYLNATYWFDGSKWHTNGTDPQITILVNATAGQVVYFCARPFSTEVGAAGTITVGFATP